MNTDYPLPEPEILLDSIDRWRQLDHKRLETYKIERYFKKYFPFVKNLVQSWERYKDDDQDNISNLRFYRIRKFEELLSSINEFWEPPSDKTKKQRCNFENNPMLYTSLQKSTPFEELEITDKETTYVIKYKAKEKTKNIRTDYPFFWDIDLLCLLSNIPSNILLSHRILREFLRSEFTKPVSYKTDFLYNISATLCSHISNSSNSDGYIYQSVTNPKFENIAFFPCKAREKLTIESILIAKLIDVDLLENKIETSILEHSPLINNKRYYISTSHKASFEDNSEEICWIPCEKAEIYNT